MKTSVVVIQQKIPQSLFEYTVSYQHSNIVLRVRAKSWLNMTDITRAGPFLKSIFLDKECSSVFLHRYHLELRLNCLAYGGCTKADILECSIEFLSMIIQMALFGKYEIKNVAHFECAFLNIHFNYLTQHPNLASKCSVNVQALLKNCCLHFAERGARMFRS